MYLLDTNGLRRGIDPLAEEGLKDFSCRGRILCESPVLEDDALLLRQMWMEISGETP
ncbi:MAG: Endonuclease IV [Anaerolineae bacterium]|jgi:hypothetical protein|nr:MAG: Endonuclease IV [Anaerolineae bacterium]